MAKKLKNSITIVGCGPGAMKYITPVSIEYINKANVLIGSKRLLNMFPDAKAEKIAIDKNYISLLKKIVLLSKTNNVVVLVSGDPGFYSFARLIIERVGIDNCNVIPGISSAQYAFASIGMTWHDAHFTTIHGRQENMDELVKAVKKHDKVAILTDRRSSLRNFARELLSADITKRKIFVCENLSLPDEQITEFTPASLQNAEVKGLNVVIVVNE